MLAKQKEIMRRRLELDSRTNAWWADGIATALRRLEDPQSLTRRAALIEALDVASLAAAARGSLGGDRYIRVVLVPGPYRGSCDGRSRLRAAMRENPFAPPAAPAYT